MTNWHQAHKDGLTFGERAADVLRNGMGSWGFIFTFLGIMAAWMGLNGDHGFDPFPFILLNLALSTLAGLQGGILLIAAKRQDAISSAMAKNDHQSIELLKAEMEILKDINRKQTELLEAVYDHLGLPKKEALS